MAERVKRPSSLWVRATAFGLVVAAVMALVAGLVSVRMVSSAARDATRETLADQADVVAAQLGDGRVAAPRVTQILSGQGIEVVRRTAGGALVGDGDAVRAARRAGLGRVTAERPLHGSATVGRTVLLVEGRGLADGGAVALVRESEHTAVGRRLVGNILLALAIGMFVAAVAGLLLARLLARPLRRTADVAVGMSHGRRDLRVPPEGPRELVEVGESLNALADALARSEARQREFLLSVSHELRTPLTSVRGFAESLADGVVAGEDEVVEVGQTMVREAERLDGLVTDLLDLARIGADDFRLDLVPTDLTALLDEAVRVWESRCAAAGIELRREGPTYPVWVKTDPRRIRQVIDGLAANAVRVTPPGAPVVFSLYDWDGMLAVLMIRDGGPGLSDEELRVAFQKGVLHSRYQGVRPVGTGIGLALVHGLVTRLDGKISVLHAPEGGVTFRVELKTLRNNFRKV
jgi:two-component system, OmpR family, sensor kinase